MKRLVFSDVGLVIVRRVVLTLGRTVVLLSLVSSSSKRVVFLLQCTWGNKRTQRILHQEDEECSYVHSSQGNEVGIMSRL